ncbi:hypothetical protein Fmac_030127 [Flemingia macrophylla]|uniref:RING-type E3 ubiquitin transferase n=1 Tax=Flemingia macrophylla TaxID=520843 RepID=A0ABD1LCI7_9FABA
MPVVTEDMKWRRPRRQLRHPISETDPNPSTVQSTQSKSTISSLFSSFSTTTNETTHGSSKSNRKFCAATLRGFGCTASASQKVSVPAVKRDRKKKNTTCDDEDVLWCGPASLDCVVARRDVSARGKLDVVERLTHRERRSYFGKRTGNLESFSFLDDDPEIFTSRPGLDSFGTSRFYRHVPHPSSEGLAEIMIIQGRIMMGGRLSSHDRFRDWRLDVDNMSYEQLLELGERIGYVNTGLKEDEMGLNIRKVKLSSSNDASKHQIGKKCSICQEEYEADDEVGRLKCEHSYHFQCIKQWLVHKNFCPVCKQEVVVRH